MDETFKFISAYCTGGGDKENLGAEISAIVAAPGTFAEDPLRGPLASALQAPDLYMPGKPPAPWKQWEQISTIWRSSRLRLPACCRFPSPLP